jgi:hypothetical protein
MDEFDHREREYREINNELVVPQYDALCRELGLGALLSAPLDTSAGRSRLHHHNDAMNLFNRLKPEYTVFKNQIVWYQFTEWGGRFRYEATPVASFLDETADRLHYLQGLEKRYLHVRTAVTWLVAIGVLVALGFATAIFVPPQFGWFTIPLAFAVAVGASSWVDRRLARVPKSMADDGRFRDAAARARALQQKATGLSATDEHASQVPLPIPGVDASDEQLAEWVRSLRERAFGVEANRGGA